VEDGRIASSEWSSCDYWEESGTSRKDQFRWAAQSKDSLLDGFQKAGVEVIQKRLDGEDGWDNEEVVAGDNDGVISRHIDSACV
jgi:hypothetical protein